MSSARNKKRTGNCGDVCQQRESGKSRSQSQNTSSTPRCRRPNLHYTIFFFCCFSEDIEERSRPVPAFFSCFFFHFSFSRLLFNVNIWPRRAHSQDAIWRSLGEEKKKDCRFLYAFSYCAYLYAHVSRIEIILIFMYDVVRSWPGEHIISSFLGSSPPLLLRSIMLKKWNCDPLWNSGACMTKLERRRKKELRILTWAKEQIGQRQQI